MKKILWIVAIVAALVRAQFPALSPYQPTQYFGLETPIEALGLVVVGGGLYKTSYHLKAGHNGDSTFEAFVLGAHGSTDCNDPVDSCQRHRAYVINKFRAHVAGDVTGLLYAGVPMKCPCFAQVRYKYENMTLTGTQWESQLTFCADSSDSCYHPITTDRNKQNYLHIGHAPLFDSEATIFQIDSTTDPTGIHKLLPKVWYTLSMYLDDDSANGIAYLWVGHTLHSSAYVLGRNGLLSYFHAGLYCSSSVAHGSVCNDDMFLAPVHDMNEAYHDFVADQ